MHCKTNGMLRESKIEMAQPKVGILASGFQMAAPKDKMATAEDATPKYEIAEPKGLEG